MTVRFRGKLPPPYLIRPREINPAECKQILIIDDDPFFRQLLKLMVAQTGLPSASILEAEDSQTAVELCSSNALHLVFCDLHLTRILSKDGIEVVRQMRRTCPKLPIYMVTAENHSDVVEAARSAGATGHLLKPVNLRILRRVLIETFVQDFPVAMPHPLESRAADPH